MLLEQCRSLTLLFTHVVGYQRALAVSIILLQSTLLVEMTGSLYFFVTCFQSCYMQMRVFRPRDLKAVCSGDDLQQLLAQADECTCIAQGITELPLPTQQTAAPLQHSR
jgi:hypothetical protein